MFPPLPRLVGVAVLRRIASIEARREGSRTRSGKRIGPITGWQSSPAIFSAIGPRGFAKPVTKRCASGEGCQGRRVSAIASMPRARRETAFSGEGSELWPGFPLTVSRSQATPFSATCTG